MAPIDSQECTVLKDDFYDDPSQLSQLLHQRAGSEIPFQSSVSTAHYHSGNATSTSSADGRARKSPPTGALQPRPDNAAHSPRTGQSRRVRFDSRYVKPSLYKYNTVPVSTGLVTTREGASKMFQSFGGHPDAPGDTQPDSQMFRQYTSGIVDSNSHVAPEMPPLLAANEDLTDPTDDCEVAGSSQSQRSPALTSPTVIQDDPETQFHFNEFPTSPLKFETPAFAGRKRNSQGQVLSSTVKTITTPGTVLSASAFFGFGNGANLNAMSLTQAFNATQAGTSPLTGAPIEDPVFQRPSPNFTHARRSSPVALLSSPIKGTAHNDPSSDPVLRSSSEPRADYETMEQSQERRQQHGRKDDTAAGAQDSWDEPDSVQRRRDFGKAKERFHQEAARSLRGVSAPTPSNRRGQKRSLLSMSTKYQSPVKPRSKDQIIDKTGQDLDAEDSPDELSQPMPVNGHHLDDDSPDELSQGDSPGNRSSRLHAIVAYQTPAAGRVQVPNTSSHPRRTLSGHSILNLSQPNTPSSQLHREALLRAPASQPLHRGVTKLRSSRDSDVVMNSQPEQTGELPSSPRPKALRYPSSPSTNHYSINMTTMNGFNSQIVESSAPPMPPRSSSPAQEDAHENEESPDQIEERVPSSPPLVRQDDDITYDEHAYDEFSGDERKETPSQGEDTGMEGAGDPPIARGRSSKLTTVESAAPAIEIEGDINEEEHIDRDNDMCTGGDGPETIEQEELHDLHNEEEELVRSSHPEDESDKNAPIQRRAERQSTIPESDMLDETQPSYYADAESTEFPRGNTAWPSTDNHTGQIQTNSTGVFLTATEQQSASLSNRVPQSPEDPMVRSLLEIANQPDTQRSMDLDTIDMPQLSFPTDPAETLGTIMPESPQRRRAKRRKITYSAKKSKKSPIKRNDHFLDGALSSPLKNGSNLRGWTPPFIPSQEHEHKDRRAAKRVQAEAVSTRPALLKSSALQKAQSPRSPRKGALKPVNRALLSPPALRQSAGTSKTSASIEAADTHVRNVDGDASEMDELAAAPPEAAVNNVTIATMSSDGGGPSKEVVVPNRVFAFWPGLQHYYPATCLGLAEAKRFQVRFDDGNINTVDAVQVRALDLRTGDQVKVDVKGMKKSTYLVVGFKDKIKTDDTTKNYPLTDRQGYATIVLEEKQRESLPAPKKEQPKNHIEVPLESIYLPQLLWSRLRDRYYKYTPPEVSSGSASRVATPGPDDDGISTPTLPRRNAAGLSFRRELGVQAGSVTSSAQSGTDVFFNMAFAITITSESFDRDTIENIINSNGGQIVDAGFHELFETGSADGLASSEGTLRTVSGLDGLLLRREYNDLGFVALISDSHSRRTKHIQALALNIPCLHIRWIFDSMAALRPLPFAKYLLPAGLSTFLVSAGAVRSRVMATYDPAGEDIRFKHVVKERELLFRGQSVLLVTGKTKRDMERKQPYIFLTYALGADDVGQCKDLASAKALLKDGEWDWVHIEGEPTALAGAASALFEDTRGVTAKRGGSKKRKQKDGVESKLLLKHALKGGKEVRVACDEFIVQSLILGALVDE